MERMDVSEDARLAALVAAVERGEDVALTRAGKVVARLQRALPRGPIIDPERLAQIHALLGDAAGGGAATVRAMRDADDH